MIVHFLFQFTEFIASFVEAIIGELVIERALGEGSFRLKNTVIGAFLIAVLIWIINQYDLFSIAATITGVVGMAICARVIYKVKLHDALVMSAAYILLLYILDFLSIAIFGMILHKDQIVVDVISSFSIMRVYYIILSKSLLSAVCYFLSKKILFKIHFRAGKMWMGVGLSAGLIYYFASISFSHINKETFFTWFFLLALVLLGLYTIFQYVSVIQEKNQMELIKERNLMAAENYERVIQNYRSNQVFYHDLKNQYLVIGSYLKNKEYAKAEDYMKNLEAANQRAFLVQWTGINALDILIECKKREAEIMGIDVEITADPITLQISEQDLVALLGNALDNAIEACQEVDEGGRWIWIGLKRIKDMTFIKVSNSRKDKAMKRTGIFPSSKTDGISHGFGLISMRMIAEKYGGTVEISCENNRFDILISFFS